MDYDFLTTQDILIEIGARIRRERLNRNLKMETVASRAGFSVIVLSRLENGSGCTLANLVKTLRVLGLLDHLDAFLPDPGISPMELLKLRGKVRQKASEK